MVSGDEVEVFCGFESAWVHGFVIHRIEPLDGSDDGVYTLRRLSDDAVLPATFHPGDVRPARASRPHAANVSAGARHRVDRIS